MLCHRCNAGISSQIAKENYGMCESCYRAYSTQEDDIDEWELSPENAHPLASNKLTQNFFWDIGDDNSPLGNDTGADILSFFREWREENEYRPVKEFLRQILLGWDVENSNWDLLDDAKIEKELKRDHYSLLTRDDSIIGLAFSQIVLEGKLDEDIKQMALSATQRQMKDIIIKFRGWDNADERKQRLVEMQKVLQEDWN